ncbi:class I SAM-dependent methyltransferase [Klenkia sp. LSe6-5]|uniref:Class I SAM-dependent methyltransferase n=1 Tax=Klenkia sesuvii TaxID=3103137 RepID=A0ABU8DSW5_9ACTN
MAGTSTQALPDGSTAAAWVDRWRDLMAGWLPEQEQVWAQVGDLVAEATAGTPVRLVDLGCGPATMACVLADRFPAAEVWGVDADPAALQVAALAAPGRVRTIEHDLRGTGWSRPLPGPADAVVSCCALHMVGAAGYRSVAGEAARALRPGGLFVDVDLHGDAEPARSAMPVADTVGRYAADLARALGRPSPADRSGQADPPPVPPGDRAGTLLAAGFSHVSVRAPGPRCSLVVARR